MPCTRCGGTGFISQYAHVQGGMCFRCKGSGRDPNSSSLLSGKKEVYREKIIDGTKVVLVTLKDLKGRFTGYSVYVEGRPFAGASCLKYGDAKRTFDVLSKRIKEEKALEALERNLSEEAFHGDGA